MSSELSGDMVFDTGALLELLDLTPNGMLIKDSLASNRLTRGHISEVSLAEATYILCRRLGHESAISKTRSLIDSGYFQVGEKTDNTITFFELTAKYKCERSISIVDCFALALAKNLSLPVLFSRREKELVREMNKKPFDVKIIFLDDFAAAKNRRPPPPHPL